MPYAAGWRASHSIRTADAKVTSIADPFDAGPYSRLQQAIGLLRRGTLRRDRWTERRRAVIIASIAWIPLVVLSAIQGLAIGETASQSLLFDFGVYSRYLVAIPILILGERLLLTRLSTILRTFAGSGFLRQVDQLRFDALLASTRRWLTHPIAEVAIVVIAYVATLAINGTQYRSDIATWTNTTGDGMGAMSFAGYWRAFVSQPLYLICVETWIWRAIVWGRLLWNVAHLDLVLVPAHPDLTAGLLFVSRSVPAFAPFAFAVGAGVAGGYAESIFFHGRQTSDFYPIVILLVMVVLATAILPLLPLIRPIRMAAFRASIEYGELASRLGRRFDERWVRDRRSVTKEALAAPDFSATTDLYSITANALRIRLLPVEFRSVMILTICTLLPFLPGLVAVLPISTLLHFGAKLLL